MDPVELILNLPEPAWAWEHVPSYYGNSNSGPALAEKYNVAGNHLYSVAYGAAAARLFRGSRVSWILDIGREST